MRILSHFAVTLVTATTLAAQAPAYQPLARIADAVRAGRASMAGPLATRIAISYEGVPLARALDDIARKSKIGLVYGEDLSKAALVTVAADTVTAAEALLRVTRGSGWSPWVDAAGQVILRRDGGRRAAADPSAPTYRVSGFVRRADSREVVRYATLIAEDDSVRAQSSTDGSFFLSQLLGGRQRIRVRALGFVPFDTTIDIRSNRTLDIALTSSAAALARVQVEAKQLKSDIDPTLPDMSVSRLDMNTIRQAPAVLGEVDPIRSLALLPGVSRTSDFSTSFTVRGGGADQNLILLDESTVYNPAHILGFLSVFNADAIDDVTLYKGAIPARFGGRLSSVLDVRQREGNAKHYGGSASIGLLASRALVEGPLPFTRGSFLVAGRRSYADAFLVLASDTAVKNSRAYFYDVNAKVNLPIGETGMVMLSGYFGRDLFGQKNSGSTGWGNTSSTLRWNQIFANRLLSKVSANSSDYDYRLGFDIVQNKITWTSRIRSSALRVDETWNITDRQSVDFGGEFGDLLVKPGDLTGSDPSKVNAVRVPPRSGLSAALYLGHTFDVGDRLSVKYGLRWSGFERRGPGLIYQYANEAPVVWNSDLGLYEKGVVRDSVGYADGRSIGRYAGVEPRASLRVGLTATSSLKASYSRTRQNLLLASRTTSPTPLDVWEPAGPYLKPQTSDQVAVGYAATFQNGTYEFSAEAYGKRLTNVADFVDGSDVLLNPQLETAIIQGNGRAYGMELFLRKQTGSVTGWVSYTLGRSEQRFDAGNGGGINGGRYFPSPSDKTHDLSVVGLVPLSERWTFGSTFTLASGLPVTYPSSRYQIDGLLVPEYGPRNGSRLPLYHRFDISFTRTTRRGELQLGIYNLYNRRNAQSMTFRQVTQQPLATEAVQLSILGVVPAISYSWHF